jgi:monoamine oxidase
VALDALTVRGWCARNTRTSAARLVTDVIVHVVLGTAPADVSMLAFLAHVRSAGGLSRLVDVECGPQEWRGRGGTG